jgi:hypothetical protein
MPAINMASENGLPRAAASPLIRTSSRVFVNACCENIQAAFRQLLTDIKSRALLVAYLFERLG